LPAESGMETLAEALLDRARVELWHEEFFRETVTGHRLLPMMKRVFGWG